jgi:hypothetical protein
LKLNAELFEEKTRDEAKLLKAELDAKNAEINDLQELSNNESESLFQINSHFYNETKTKENSEKTKSIESLKLLCAEQEQTISKLKSEFGSVQEEKQNEMENKLSQVGFCFLTFITQLVYELNSAFECIDATNSAISKDEGRGKP